MIGQLLTAFTPLVRQSLTACGNQNVAANLDSWSGMVEFGGN